MLLHFCSLRKYINDKSHSKSFQQEQKGAEWKTKECISSITHYKEYYSRCSHIYHSNNKCQSKHKANELNSYYSLPGQLHIDDLKWTRWYHTPSTPAFHTGDQKWIVNDSSHSFYNMEQPQPFFLGISSTFFSVKHQILL